MQQARTTGPIAEAVRRELSELVTEIGDVRAGRELGVGRQTVTRAAAGLAVRPSVAIAIEHGLASRRSNRAA